MESGKRQWKVVGEGSVEQDKSVITTTRQRGDILFLFILMFLPWLDTSKIRSAVFRPLYKAFFWILVIDVIILGYIGANPPEGLYLLVGRIATIYYFVHFILIMPILGFKEKTIPLPISISDPVLSNQARTISNR